MEKPNTGLVLAVRGSVVEAGFDVIPEINHILTAGPEEEVVIETAVHLDDHTVRGIALTSTQGLGQGDPVIDRGTSLTVPVGDRLLGRVFNVFGETIDKREQIAGGNLAFRASAGPAPDPAVPPGTKFS